MILHNIRHYTTFKLTTLRRIAPKHQRRPFSFIGSPFIRQASYSISPFSSYPISAGRSFSRCNWPASLRHVFTPNACSRIDLSFGIPSISVCSVSAASPGSGSVSLLRVKTIASVMMMPVAKITTRPIIGCCFATGGLCLIWRLRHYTAFKFWSFMPILA